MAIPRSAMVRLVGMFEELKDTPRVSGIGTFRHQGMALGHASFLDAFHGECYLFTHRVSHFTHLSHVLCMLLLRSTPSPLHMLPHGVC